MVSLTNLVLGERIFPEFLQQEVQVPLLTRAMLAWWQDPAAWTKVTSELAKLPGLLAGGEKDVGGMMAKEMV